MAKPTVEERFWAKVDKTETCWLWTAGRNRDGYGLFSSQRGGQRSAHRIAYEWERGPIPDGLQIDHLCRVTSCVNPAHLEAVTGRVNMLRGFAPPAINARKTHCINGHEFTPENTFGRSD